MSYLHIHYIPATGEITCWDNGYREDGNMKSHMKGSIVLTKFFDEAPPDLKSKKIDTATSEIVDKTPAELASENLPTAQQVINAVYVELSATDKYVLPDFPITSQQQNAWKSYRKALRDISKGNPAPTLATMIAAWPLDPNGNDAIPQLRVL